MRPAEERWRKPSVIKIWLVNIFDNTLIFRKCCGKRINSHRAAVEFFDNSHQKPPILRFKPGFIKSSISRVFSAASSSTMRRVLPRNRGRGAKGGSPRAASRAKRAPRSRWLPAWPDTQNFGRPGQYFFNIFEVVIIQPQRRAEPRTQRLRQKIFARGRGDQA